MESQADILRFLSEHASENAAEKTRLQSFVSFVETFGGEQLFDRSNFAGHITASAFIINGDHNKLLLLRHRFLNRWLQPGGHVDVSDGSLLLAALREAVEETGIAADQFTLLYNGVFDFDSHAIPENKRKQEAPHFHHDARFLFQVRTENAIQLAADESTDAKWIALSELANDQEFGRVIQKIEQMQLVK